MRIVGTGLALLLTTLVSSTALAQNMRPGEWEITRSGGNPAMAARLAEMRSRMDKMPPAERKRIEAMLDVSGQPTAGTSGGLVVKTCVTPQQASKYDFSAANKEGCAREVQERTGNAVRVKSRCSNGTTAEFTATFVSDTAFDGKMTLTLPSVPMPQTTKLSGKWIGPSCSAAAR